MDNPKYIQVMRQVASDFDGISHELFQVASDLERMDQESIIMSKFLPIGTKGELLNSDMIARIIPKEDGGCIILTKDGQHFHSEIDLHDEVNDYNSIRSIIPCQGVSAVYLDDDGDSEICPCAFVMLMSDGKIEPFVFATDKDIERIANKGHTGFIGFVPTK